MAVLEIDDDEVLFEGVPFEGTVMIFPLESFPVTFTGPANSINRTLIGDRSSVREAQPRFFCSSLSQILTRLFESRQDPHRFTIPSETALWRQRREGL